MVIIYTGVSGRGLNTRPSAGSRTSDLGLPLSARKMRLLSSLSLGLALFLGFSDARIITKDEVRERQREAVKRWAAPGPAEFLPMEKRATVKNITFKNPRASGMLEPLEPIYTVFTFPTEFFVDGTSIPEVSFDVGPSWAGLLPISNAANETRKVRYCCALRNTVIELMETMTDVLLVLPSRSTRKLG